MNPLFGKPAGSGFLKVLNKKRASRSMGIASAALPAAMMISTSVTGKVLWNDEQAQEQNV